MTRIAPGCRVFDEDLSAWIDGELDAQRRAAVGAHLAGCPACTARVEQLREVDRALRALPAPTAGAELRERLARRVSGDRAPAAAVPRRSPPRPRRRLAAALALPLAAAAALVLYLALRPRAQSGPQPEEPRVAEQAVPAPVEGELEALDAEDLAVVLDLDTIEDLPVIANLDVIERLLEAEAG